MNLREEIHFWRVPGWEDIEIIRGKSVVRECPRHWHEEIHMCLIEAGGGTLFYSGSSYETPAESLFIVQPGEMHGNHTDNSAGCSYRTLNITPEIYKRFLIAITGSENYSFTLRTPIIFDADILGLFRNAYRTFESSSSNLERDSLLMELFARLVVRYSNSQPNSLKVKSERFAIKKVCEYLEQNLAENILLKDLSEIANLSPFHFSRTFLLEKGIPPHAYQTQLRIIRAKHLLRNGEALSSVASMVGFADQSHFTRHFKRIVGTTPGQYMQNSKNVQDFTIRLL
jgi:AraC-like DNA-binding protein